MPPPCWFSIYKNGIDIANGVPSWIPNAEYSSALIALVADVADTKGKNAKLEQIIGLFIYRSEGRNATYGESHPAHQALNALGSVGGGWDGFGVSVEKMDEECSTKNK
jgi:hypothetical protein